MICEICGRPDVTSDSRTWDQARHYADSLCWRRSLTNRPGKDADCYRIGYEREKARAEKAEAELICAVQPIDDRIRPPRLDYPRRREKP